MLLKFTFSILLTCLFTLTYGQESLIGNWRRVDPNIENQDTTSKQPQWGDLQINADSTFHVEGNSATKNSTISGWHSGDEYNGTWELGDNNRLTLWLDRKKYRMYLSFIIINITQDKLVLRLSSGMNDKKKYITYLRI
jgi:hypothetical protein